MKSGFVNIFGKPNAGKSSLLNSLLGEKLAIVTPKVQTTRHRIKGILTGKDYQVIFSDTPGIIEPKYKLHEKMMMAVKSAMEDADVALLILDVYDDWEENDRLFSSLHLSMPALLLINKSERISDERKEQAIAFFKDKPYARESIFISALKKKGMSILMERIIAYLPEGQPFFDGEDLTDLPTRFFAGEMIREKIFYLYEDEIPYHYMYHGTGKCYQCTAL